MFNNLVYYNIVLKLWGWNILPMAKFLSHNFIRFPPPFSFHGILPARILKWIAGWYHSINKKSVFCTWIRFLVIKINKNMIHYHCLPFSLNLEIKSFLKKYKFSMKMYCLENPSVTWGSISNNKSVYVEGYHA